MPDVDLTGPDKFITDLDPTNPVGATDKVYILDNFIRGIQNVLKNTFPELNGAITATAAQLNQLNWNLFINPVTFSKGCSHFETKYLGTSGTAFNVDWKNTNGVYLLLNANCTLTFSKANGAHASLGLIIQQDQVGSRSITWPTNVFWPNRIAPSLSTAPASFNFFKFEQATLGPYLIYIGQPYINVGQTS